MNFKNFVSGLLCFSLMFSMAIPTFAAETTTHEIIYQNEPHYEITIPDSSNIDVSTGKGTIDIGVSDANLAEDTMVAITASSSNYANDSWNLVNIKDNTDKIAYTIGTTDGGNDIFSGDIVVATKDASDVTLYVTVSDTSKIGTFSDIITFTSEIVESVSLISFTIDGVAYQAKEGMTWGDWIDSKYDNYGRLVVGDFNGYTRIYVDVDNDDIMNFLYHQGSPQSPDTVIKALDYVKGYHDVGGSD